MLGVQDVSAQAVSAIIDDGYYYIQSAGNTNYYINASNNNYNNNPNTPYLRTSLTRDNSSVWHIVRTYIDGAIYYRIIHYDDGKYVYASENTGARAVHLRSISAENLDNNSLFVIATTNFGYAIIPYRAIGNNLSFNPFGGHSNDIGLYQYSNDKNSQWKLLSLHVTPTISVTDAGVLNISTTETGVTIHYTTDGSIPSASSATYATPITLDQPRTYTIKAVVVDEAGLYSSVATYRYVSTLAPKVISSLSEITDPCGHYKLAADITTGSGTGIDNFSGMLDGDYHTISGLRSPLFGRVSGAVVKNLKIDKVNISNGTDNGAIASVSAGDTRIYNCGVLSSDGTSTISGSGAVGGLLGLITDQDPDNTTRVVNCYNYATIHGGTYAAGIVGRNMCNVGNVRIALCMMYGDIKSGSKRSPVYGGVHVSNVQNFTEYNYYRSKADLTYTDYNDQLAIDKDEFLTRFPFYRHILNTHRQMAAYFLFDNITDESLIGEIGHWALKSEVAPYPIVEPWERNTTKTLSMSPPTIPAGNADRDYNGRLITEMGNNGYLDVKVVIGDKTYSGQSLPITDMDTTHFDFTWGKVVLPFANEYSGWTHDYDYICTGWKITSITGGTAGTYANYNMADRDCTTKDLYSTSNFIYAQGGNYVVPYGVTAITIEANFARAYYLSDPAYDMGYTDNYATSTQLVGTVPTTYHGKTVYTSLSTLMSQLATGKHTPHEQAIVLVGNFHYNQKNIGAVLNDNANATKGLTIMSVDEDCNQEPDYGWYSYHSTDRTLVPAIRFDFVPNIGIGMAARVTGSTPNPSIGIWHPRGWFELTETCVSFMSEFEVSNNHNQTFAQAAGNNRVIANSGYFIQIVRCRNGNSDKMSYMQIGGNAYVKELYPGSHTDRNDVTTLRPINVTGGEIVECYMTGYNAGASATGQNVYFWCTGGRIHKWLGAYLEKNNTEGGVNVNAKIDHSRIYRFFGGGTSAAAPVTGNINVTINNSFVDFYCGGPEFGDMAAGKTITTNATGTRFREYYGAGFGGTSISYQRKGNQTSVNFQTDKEFPCTFAETYTNNRLQKSDNLGLGTCYKFEYILYSGGSGTGVARSYTGYAKFSLATAGNVVNNLTSCTVEDDFYGGGCQGMVDGTINSTLTGCTFMGNVYGGGYKAAATTVHVYPVTSPVYSTYIKETGLFTPFNYDAVTPEEYTWQQGTEDTYNAADKVLYTSTDMSTIGNVRGDISISIDSCKVGYDAEGNVVVGGGNVYGGGNESPSRSGTTILITGDADIAGNVFGGGNVAHVDGNTSTTISNKTAGDNLLRPQVVGDVYGGGALANTGNTTLNLMGGILGNAYGGGLGRIEVAGQEAVAGHGEPGDPDYVAPQPAIPHVDGVAALVGNVAVNVNGAAFRNSTDTDGVVTEGRVFGCNNLNGTPTGSVTLHVYKTVNVATGSDNQKPERTTNSIDAGTYELQCVYGGGNQAAYIPATNQATNVIIDGCGLTSIKYVYGGGNAAAVPATSVVVNGTYEIGGLFGGGNGKDRIDGMENPGADVGLKPDGSGGKTTYGSQDIVGRAHVTIYGGVIHQMFGGSNTKGDVTKSATVQLGDQNLQSCEFRVNEVYGGGNEAPMSGEAKVELKCIEGLDEIYGGSRMAPVEGDVTLTITGGTYKKVFGGNNISGNINGSITVNIKESGCLPVIIGELYGAGNKAPYSVYGYADGGYGAPLASGERKYADPQVNIISATDIGTVYGGGLGEEAVVYGNTRVNINMEQGHVNGNYEYVDGKSAAGNDRYANSGTPITLPLGFVGTVFGGGNQAKVVGNTSVQIATGTDADGNAVFQTSDSSRPRFDAQIRSNIYGGGNNADVTGSTSVVIGQE